MNLIKHKYHKAIDIESETMCPNTDTDIDLPHLKCL